MRRFRTPRRKRSLAASGDELACGGCGVSFPVSNGIPLLFAPNEWSGDRADVTDAVKAFYEETPFPNYDDFDSVATLVQKARKGIFASMLDEQLPPGVRVIECGCGTGQLSNFLSSSGRTVFGTDICENSLRLGQSFARQHGLSNVSFVQMNLFRTAFKPGSFHFVISNGVLHHTSDPKQGFLSRIPIKTSV